jgi:hypothetical protein
MRGVGDVPGNHAYHADLTCGFGVQYVWRGRVTSVIGQNVPRQLGGIFATRHPVSSARTLAKEVAKGVLARGGHAKYAMHGPNDVLRRAQLRDGRPVYEFLRCNPHWGGVEHADTAAGLARTLTPRLLDRLVARAGACVFYTHLGKGAPRDEPFDAQTSAAFRRLADRFHAGELLVTTTRRLLGFHRALRELSFTPKHGAAGRRIDVSTRGGSGDGDSLSPLAVLNRGYSITRRLPDGPILRSAEGVGAGDRIAVRLAAGSLHAHITETFKEQCDGQGEI